MRNLVLSLCLLVPSLSFAAGGPKGVVAASPNELKTAIQASMKSYNKVPSSQLGSAKFKGFLANPENYVRIDLTPKGLQDVTTTAYVAGTIYPGKVFVSRGSLFGPKGPTTSWSKGPVPKS